MVSTVGTRPNELWGRPGSASRFPAIDGLLDVHLVAAPDGGLASPVRPGVSLSAAELAELCREVGSPGPAVRIDVPAQEHTLPTLAALAGRLGCDVLAAPPGARLIELPPRDRPGGSSLAAKGEVLAVDALSGMPVDWLAIPATGRIGSVPTWFDGAGGRIRSRLGRVTIPLAGGGLMLATRGDFITRRAAAAALRPGHPGIVTLAVGVSEGQLVIGHYDGRSTRCDGAQFVAALPTLPLYGVDLRMWLAWPEPAAERVCLAQTLTQLAEATGATVWAPPIGGRAEVREGCHDLAALGRDGEPLPWRPFGPARPPRFESDVDGRLVPLGDAVVTRYAGVPFVSLSPDQEQRVAGRYAALAPTQEAFLADLAVLADGRLAMRYRDGRLLAAGPGYLREALLRMGWPGTPLVLLSTPTAEQAEGALRHAAVLAGALGTTVTLDRGRPGPAPNPMPAVSSPSGVGGSAARSDATVDPGTGAATGSGADPGYSRAAVAGALATPATNSDQGQRQVALSRAVVDYLVAAQAVDRAPVSDRARLVLALERAAREIDDLARPLAVPAAPAVPGRPEADPHDEPVGRRADRSRPAESSRFIDGPRLAATDRLVPAHRIPWLPRAPQANSEEFDLFLECPIDPAEAVVGGVPSARLYLLGHLDRDRLAGRTVTSHLLRVRVGPWGAVDVDTTGVDAPPDDRDLLDHSDVYLLPAAWLDRCRIVSALRAVGQNLVEQPLPDEPAVLLRCAGARHGVPGLPDESVRWPRGSRRSTGTHFVLLPEGLPLGHDAWVRLHRRRPAPSAGHRLLELVVPRDAAIDVAATAHELQDLSSVRSVAGDLAAGGDRLILPATAHARTVVVREYGFAGGRWHRSPVRPRPNAMDAAARPD